MYLCYQDMWTHYHVKERISRFTKGDSPITENLINVKAIVDELSINNSPLNDINLFIHTLNGLGTKYHEITTAIRTWENPIRVMGYLTIFRSRPFNVWMTRLISSAIAFDICDFGDRDGPFGESRESFFELHDACNTLASKHVLNDLPSLLGCFHIA